jgi:cellobiose-specific phosphotransferase system component IIA
VSEDRNYEEVFRHVGDGHPLAASVALQLLAALEAARREAADLREAAEWAEEALDPFKGVIAPANARAKLRAALDSAREETTRLNAEVARYRARVVAHHNITHLSEEAIRESIGYECAICHRADRLSAAGAADTKEKR